MIKSIHSDLYRSFNRMYMFVLIICIAGLSIIVNIALSTSRPEIASVSSSWGLALNLLTFPMFLLPMLVDIVFAEEYKEHTLKNTVAFGTNRAILFISKNITIILLGILLAAITFAVWCGSSLILLNHDAHFTGAFISDFFMRVGASCVDYVACIAVASFVAVLLKRSSLFVFAYYGVIFFMKYVFMLFKVPFLNKYLLSEQIAVFGQGSAAQIQNSLLVCLVTLAVFIALGLVSFKKQDVS